MEEQAKEASVSKMPKVSKEALIRIVAVIAVVAILVGGYYYSAKRKAEAGTKQAQEKVVVFVEKNLVQPGTKVEVTSATFENGLYKIVIKVGAQEVPTYLTQDGKTFFPQGIDMTEAEKKVAEEQVAAEIPKSDKPQVDLFVMSFCPYGNKAEDTLKPVYDLLKNKVDFNFHYIVTTSGDTVSSLHGAKEVTENEKEACVLKLAGKDKWFSIVSYVNSKCGADGACFEAGAKTLGINTAQVNACVASEGIALMKANEQVSNAAGANGSPTMTINGVETTAVYQYGNSEGYKKAICDSFNAAPEECAKVLASQATAAQAAAQGGSCN
jgi:glutaredoxin